MHSFKMPERGCIDILRERGGGQATHWHGGCTNASRSPLGTAFSGLLRRAGGKFQRFLETKDSESRLRDEYCALEGSRTRDIAENQDGTVTNRFRTDGGGRKRNG
jgi:hypothetical protein